MFPLRPPELVAWRPAVEKPVQDATERKICGIVIRPSVVYGRGGGKVAKLLRRQLPLIGTGDNHWSFVHVDDLADLTRSRSKRRRLVPSTSPPTGRRFP
jgi:nucleoside-diphosphate-sugar epimerase